MNIFGRCFELIMVFRETVCWVAALVSISGGHCLADDAVFKNQKSRSVEFRIQIAPSLLQDAGDIPSGGDDGEPVAARDVFLFVPSLPKLRGNIVNREWLLGRAKEAASHSPREHRFVVEDGQLTPAASIAIVGEVFFRCDPNGQEVSLLPLEQPAIGPSVAGLSKVSLVAPDVLPSKLIVGVGPSAPRPAYLLVSDHGVATTTDAMGWAEFKDLPDDFQFSCRVNYPWLKDSVIYHSDTLEISPSGKFTLKSEHVGIAHSIRIVPAAPQSTAPEGSERQP